MGDRLRPSLDALRAPDSGWRKRIATLAQGRQFLLVLPWLVLVFGLAVTHGLWRSAYQDADRTLGAEFEFWADKVV